MVGVNGRTGTRWWYGRTVTSSSGAEPGGYRPFAAHRLALVRLARPRERRLAGDPVLRGHVQQGLDRRWSPERIAHPLRAQFPDNRAWHLVHESIYQAIYAKDASLGRDRFGCLATGRRRRRPDRTPDG